LHNSGLANTALVSLSSKSTDIATTCAQTNKEPAISTQQTRHQTPSPFKTTTSCLPFISKRLESSNLSSAAQNLILASWRPSTLKQYQSYLQRWERFCTSNAVDIYKPSVEQVIEFLTSLFNDSLGYSAINTARSALSSIITVGNTPIGEHPLICRLMKGAFQLKPSLPKYSYIWDVGQLFSYFQEHPPIASLSLKELSYTTATLLCLLTGQRCQTLHAMDLRYIQVLPDRLHISIQQVLKTTKPGKHQAPFEIQSFPSNECLCIVKRIHEYLSRTAPLRKTHTQLFISFQSPFQPVSKDTIARWVKETLKLAGIDTGKFSAHSCRAASTSAAHKAGLSLPEIMAAAGWSNARTFAQYYCKTIDKYNFGQHILVSSSTLTS